MQKIIFKERKRCCYFKIIDVYRLCVKSKSRRLLSMFSKSRQSTIWVASLYHHGLQTFNGPTLFWWLKLWGWYMIILLTYLKGMHINHCFHAIWCSVYLLLLWKTLKNITRWYIIYLIPTKWVFWSKDLRTYFFFFQISSYCISYL